jgi:hypothetical protein
MIGLLIPNYVIFARFKKANCILIKEKKEQHLRNLDDYKNKISQYGIKSSPIIPFIPNFSYASNIPYIF